jgi:S1-C subfamily serine protease
MSVYYVAMDRLLFVVLCFSAFFAVANITLTVYSMSHDSVYTFKPKAQVNYLSGHYEPSQGVENWTALYEDVSPSVVSVMALSLEDGQEVRREGTGFFIDPQYVITNQHVVATADSIEVELSSGDKLITELVGSDEYTDLAVLKTERAVNVTSLILANSSVVIPGTPVAAVGNPFGLHGSISSGIISAKGRTLKTLNDFLIVNLLQTDAPLNPGNSGGPLITVDGLVVGVTLAKEGDNVGFAIPSNTVRKVVPALMEGKEYKHPWIGVVAQPVTKRLALQLQLPTTRGLQILQINEGGPADSAGLRGSDKLRRANKTFVMSGGDIITEINGYGMDSFVELMNFLEDETAVGDNITVSYLRNNTSYNTTLTLGQRK